MKPLSVNTAPPRVVNPETAEPETLLTPPAAASSLEVSATSTRTSATRRRPCLARDSFKRLVLLYFSGGVRSGAALKAPLNVHREGQNTTRPGQLSADHASFPLGLGHFHPGRRGVYRPHPRNLLQDRPDPPTFELVIARIDQDISWLDEVPEPWHISVYDQDIASTWGLPKRQISRMDLTGGQQSYAFARHVERFYDNLADFTAFAPADALTYAPRYVDLLSQPKNLRAVQVMSLRSTDSLPPAAFLRRDNIDLIVRPERVSLRTLDSIFYRDTQHMAAMSYRSYYRLHDGSNLLAHFFANIGLPGWIPEGQDLGTIAHAGMFGAHREQFLQHSQFVYESMKLKDLESPVIGEIANKAWLLLLGGPEFLAPHMRPARQHVRPARDSEQAATEATKVQVLT